MRTHRKVTLGDLNASLVCKLCGGYYVDATTLIDCMHAFCRACILRHFEHKLACPTCNMVYKKKNHSWLRQDVQLQTLVYKIVPGLYAREMQRREDFHRSTGVRASSSCSDDSLLGDMMHDHEEWIHSSLGDDNPFLSPDDSISLSLEYYQLHLDQTSGAVAPEIATGVTTVVSDNDIKDKDKIVVACDESKTDGLAPNDAAGGGDVDVDAGENKPVVKSEDDDVKDDKVKDRRYLQCPAAVSMTHLQKFLRMKYALSAEHKVDVIYEGEVLPSSFSLIDVAYTFKWQRTKPMRFFYRIFTPMKVRPIKIINTSSTGQKQLQIVPVTPTSEQQQVKSCPPPPAVSSPLPEIYETDAQNQRNKERLMAELRLQSKNSQNSRYGKTYESASAGGGGGKGEKRKHAHQQVGPSVYDYEEPDEEMKRFAEKRDREWQLQKHLDAADEHKVSKKRKKSKHKSDSSKKRKLRAQITSEVSNLEESIKLKVKLTPHNGHKHKHHKSAQNQPDRTPAVDASSKEKLLQMRQIRHKNIGEEKLVVQAATGQSFDKIKKPKQNLEGESKGEFTITIAKSTDRAGESRIKTSEARTKSSETQTQTKTTETQMKTSETQTKSSETQTVIGQSKAQHAKPNDGKDAIVGGKGSGDVVVTSGKTLRSDFSFKTNATRDLCTKQTATVQIERNEMMERQAQAQQKTFLRTFPSNADKYAKIAEKVATVKVENVCKKLTDQAKYVQATKPMQLGRPQQKQPDGHVAKPEKKVSFEAKPPHILNAQFHTHSGFTVSKIETGAKRKAEPDESVQDNRPSLEITLINPPVSAPPKQSPTPPAKRPPPATIPLDRIKKSITLKSGISIIPKMPERCDNVGPLDLSKPHKVEPIKPNGLAAATSSTGNGFKQLAPSPGRVRTPDKNVQLSNLQMLSKVASEHPNLNKPLLQAAAKPRPQMPSLQTLKIPNPQQQQLQQHQNNAVAPPKSSNLAKLPKLNEINKSQFRMVNNLRTMRPNQNQSIRNIPNPSLLVRQQNQNRLNSLGGQIAEVKDQVKKDEVIVESDKKGDVTEIAAITVAPVATAAPTENNQSA